VNGFSRSSVKDGPTHADSPHGKASRVGETRPDGDWLCHAHLEYGARTYPRCRVEREPRQVVRVTGRWFAMLDTPPDCCFTVRFQQVSLRLNGLTVVAKQELHVLDRVPSNGCSQRSQATQGGGKDPLAQAPAIDVVLDKEPCGSKVAAVVPQLLFEEHGASPHGGKPLEQDDVSVVTGVFDCFVNLRYRMAFAARHSGQSSWSYIQQTKHSSSSSL